MFIVRTVCKECGQPVWHRTKSGNDYVHIRPNGCLLDRLDGSQTRMERVG